jgi:hypothetical protein
MALGAGRGCIVNDARMQEIIDRHFGNQ